MKSDIINIYHSYQILISDSFRSRLTGSLLQTQGISRYYATFLSQISFLPLLVTTSIKCISFISNPHIRILQIKASVVTTSNAGNYKVLCNMSLRNFIPFASNYISHHLYIIHIKSSYQIPPNQDFWGHLFNLRELQGTMTFLLQDHFLPLCDI